MGIMTISIDNEVEEQFRVEAAKNYSGKGHLGKAVTEALRDWVEVKQQKWIADEELVRLKNGFNMGDKLYTSRDDLHGR